MLVWINGVILNMHISNKSRKEIVIMLKNYRKSISISTSNWKTLKLKQTPENEILLMELMRQFSINGLISKILIDPFPMKVNTDRNITTNHKTCIELVNGVNIVNGCENCDSCVIQNIGTNYNKAIDITKTHQYHIVNDIKCETCHATNKDHFTFSDIRILGSCKFMIYGTKIGDKIRQMVAGSIEKDIIEIFDYVPWEWHDLTICIIKN